VVLTLGALALVGALALSLGYFGGQFSRWLISVETEVRWAEDLQQKLEATDTHAPLRSYLDSLGERVGSVMALPAGMNLKLIYSDDETVNAFATLGGTILIYRGLLRKIPHENALVMLIAHEVAHLERRDPIVSIGSAIGIQTALTLVFSTSEITPLQDVGLYTQFAFSRDMERHADKAALQALAELYGHVSGADDLFKVIQSERREKGNAEPPAFLNTHPLDAERIEDIARMARERGWRTDRPTIALPVQFKEWLDGDAAKSEVR
jgi:predicted Zn-dependent protease